MMSAGIIFVIASLTDFLDGFIARKYQQITTFGKFIDPIADKFLVNSVLIMFAVYQIIPI
jgi:CDP-diacylglycerol--glycerol-3-phosphate 3-phosphatidyltransferase